MRLLIPALLALLPSALVLAAPAGKGPFPRATDVTTTEGRTISIRSDAKEPTKFDGRLSLSILDVYSISCPEGNTHCKIAAQTGATIGVFEKDVEERTKLVLSTRGPELGSTDKYGYTVRIECATELEVPVATTKIALGKPATPVYLVKLTVTPPTPERNEPPATDVTTTKGRTISIRSDSKEPTKFDGRLSLSILDVLSISCPEGDTHCKIAAQTGATIGVFEKDVEERTKLVLSTRGPQLGSTDKYGYTVRIEGATEVKLPVAPTKIALVKPAAPVYLVKLTVTPPTPERDELLRNKQMWVAARNGRAYSMIEARSCMCTEATRGPVQLHVSEDGSISSGTYVRSGKGVDANLLLGSEQVFFSINQLFDNALEYLNQGASVKISYDKKLGYPVSFRSDLSPYVADDEFEYTVADVEFKK